MRALPLLLAAWLVLFARALCAHPMSAYEKESLRLALAEVSGRIDPSPAGKVVEAIDVVTLDVIEPRDPAPGFLNWFHAKTRPDVVDREVLVRPGQVYDEKLIRETERNLRVRQSSVVLIAATRSKTPGRVRLLVVTKDVWSLRLNWDVVAVNGRLQALYLQPSEENLLGRHKILNGNLYITQSTYTAGIGFMDTRIAGTRLQTAVNANLIWNCTKNELEGSSGSFWYGKPLYSTRTRWGWVAAAEWQEDIVRPAGTVGQSVCHEGRAVGIDFPGPPAVTLPYEYHRDALRSQIAATRSFGDALKQDISFGLESVRRVYRPVDLGGQPQVIRDEFDKLLPTSDTRLSPFVQLHGYENRYHRVLDVETLALQEDFRLGHDVWVRAYPASRSVGSSRNLMGVFSGVGYTIPVWDGMARAYVASTIEVSDPRHSDAQIEVGARAVTPRLGFGRVVVDGYAIDRVVNYLNPLQSLGGTTRLRGYRPYSLVGPNEVVANVELRSRPIEIFSIQFGAVGFYDVGDAFRTFDAMHLRQGAGVGLRVLLPQLDRTVLRVDFGFPLDPSDPNGEVTLVIRFHQAFDPPLLTSPALVP